MAASPCFCGRLISLHCTLKPIPSCFSKFFSPTRISSLLDHCHQHAPILKRRPIIFGLTYLSHYCSISWFFTAKLTETIFAHIRCLQFLNLLQFFNLLKSGFYSYFTETSIFKCPFVSKSSTTSLSLPKAVFDLLNYLFLPESNFLLCL